MKKHRVGVDCDGVVADILTPCFRVASEMLGREIKIDHLESWSLDSILPKDRLEEFWLKIGEPGLCRNLVPYPGAVEGMRALSEVADVYIVTSHLHDAPQWTYERDQWFAEHFGIHRHKMVHTHSKHVFAGAMLIDDKPQNVEEWAEEHPLGIPVLWAQPYNFGHVFGSHRTVRTNSWREIVAILEELPR